MNKRFLSALAIGSLVLSLGASCNKSSSGDEGSETEGNWIKKASFGGASRGFAVSFVIDSTAYVGTGRGNTSSTGYTRLSDFWAFSASANSTFGGWTQLNAPLAQGRYGASAFAIGSKGYVGTGYDDSTSHALNDFYQYDPTTNIWTKKASFPALRKFAVGFAINSKGYIGTGQDDNNNVVGDFYEYDPNADTWKAITSYPGEKRYGAVAFVANNEAYITTGTNGSATTSYDFFKFDGTNWTQLRNIYNTSTDDYDDNYTTIERTYATSFVIGNIAYLTSGTNQKTWAYIISDDRWEKRTPYQKTNRAGSVGFTIGSIGFVGTGLSGGSVSGSPTDGFSSFDPTQDYDENDDK